MRRHAIQRLKDESFDALVLGGGINGAGVARDLALRARATGLPLRIGLVEQRHFASGTSGRNSQLIHGGLRYLKHFEFGLVRQALHERAVLTRMAPALVKPQPFLMPVYSATARYFYGAGLALYDALAGSHNIGRHRRLSKAQIERLEPGLAREGLFCGLEFWDCRVHSARFVLANVLEAVRNGVAAANYVQAESWTRERGAWRVSLKDTLSGELFETRARKLVDTTGPWSRAGELRRVRGSHLVFPRLNASDRAIAWFESSGRIVFVIPWPEAGDVSLVGTTDVDHAGGPGDVRIGGDEMAYLLGVAKTLFPRAVLEPVAAFSSLRPLLREEGASASGTSREHRIWNTDDGILRVAGGKYTTYRVMGEEAADAVAREIAPALAGLRVTASAPLEDEPAADEAAQIERAVEKEMAQRLADLLFVSTYWGYSRRWDAPSLEPYAREMGRRLGWDRRREGEEIEAVLCALSFPASRS